MFTAEEAWGVVRDADCSSHPNEVNFKAEDIDTVFWFDYWCNCGSYSSYRKQQEEEAAKRFKESKGEGLDDVDIFSREKGVCNSYCDSGSEAYFRLKDGRYVIAVESSDTSGHG